MVGHSVKIRSLHSKHAFLVAFAFGCALSALGQDNVRLQIANLKNSNLAIRQNAASVLGRFGDPRAIEPLIATLKDSDPSVRAAAATSLRFFKDARAVEPLIPLLNDPDESVSISAGMALGSLRDPRAIPPLIASMDHSRVAMVALMQIGAPAVPPLIAALREGDAHTRAMSADALGSIPDPRAVDPLIAAMKDPDVEVRTEAAAALSTSQDPRAVEPLIAALKDPDPAMRAVVAGMIQRIKDPRVLPAVIAALGDSDNRVRERAVQSLGVLGGPRAIEALSGALQSKDQQFRWVIVNALGHIQDPRAVDALIKVFSDDPVQAVRWIAADGLGNLGDRRAANVLLKVFADGNAGDKTSAAMALGKIKEPRAVAPLTAAIKSSGNNEQYFIALGRIGAPSVDSLLEFVKSPATCSLAADALGATKDPRIVEPLLILFQTPYSGPPVPQGGAMGGTGGMGGQATTPRPICYQAIMHALSATDDPRVIGPIVQYMRTGPISRDRVPGELFHFGSLAIAPLLPLLHDPDPRTRQIAAEALSRIEDPRVKTVLLAALKERDLSAIRGAYQFYVSLGQPGSEDVLAESLDRYPDQAMAEYFLNCGDVKLEDAARSWGAKQHWQITQQVYGVTWGKPLERPKLL